MAPGFFWDCPGNALAMCLSTDIPPKMALGSLRYSLGSYLQCLAVCLRVAQKSPSTSLHLAKLMTLKGSKPGRLDRSL